MVALALGACTGASDAPGTTTARTPEPSTTSATPTAAPPSLTSCAATQPPSTKPLTALPTTAKDLALTFDVEYDDAGLDAVVRLLADSDAPATFFVSSAFAERFPARVRALAGAGEVGVLLDDGSPKDAAVAVAQALGEPPAAYVRLSPAADASALTACGTAVEWSLDTLGWRGFVGGQSVASVTRRVSGALAPGLIVRMVLGANPTDHSTLDAEALPAVLRAISTAGYRIVSLP